MRALIFAVALSLAFLVLVLVAVRRRTLREGFALLWIAVGTLMLLASATLPLHVLSRLARLLGIAYPPDLLLLLAIVFLLTLVLKLAASLSRLSSRVTELAQELALSRLDVSKRITCQTGDLRHIEQSDSKDEHDQESAAAVDRYPQTRT